MIEKILKIRGLRKSSDGGGSGGGEELKITNALYLFYGGSRLDVIEPLCAAITDECTDFSSMFYNCPALTTVPEFDTSNGTKFNNMFHNCGALTTIPKLDTSNGTEFGSMFSTCGALTTVPKLDTSNGTKFGSMFYNCWTLTAVPKLDTSNGTEFGSMFYQCNKLTTVPELDTSNGTKFNNMFSNCWALTTIPKLDTSNGTNFINMFSECKALTNLYLYNIRKSIQIGSGTSWGHLLTVDSLVHTIKELCTVTSSQTLTMGTANLEKISGLYCKIIDDTHEKKTMELCESTDAGAMTLTDYALTKGWSIA